MMPNESPALGVPDNSNCTPMAVAVPPLKVPVEIGRLSALTGAVYNSKSVALVNLSTAPSGKAAL
ncbi:hypothetical protein D3C77_624600 [compost metagenome]